MLELGASRIWPSSLGEAAASVVIAAIRTPYPDADLTKQYLIRTNYLKQFVTETLVQISEGIEEAKRQLKERGSAAIVNTNMPKDRCWSFGYWRSQGSRRVR